MGSVIEKRGDHFLAPGTKVRLEGLRNDDDEIMPEFGVVVHCWLDLELCAYDCYVAFFGDAFPEGKPVEKPYIFRYAATSLTVLRE